MKRSSRCRITCVRGNLSPKNIVLNQCNVGRVTLYGCIREGAILIQNAADVLEAVGSIDPRMVRQGSFDFIGAPVSSDVAAQERAAVIGLLGPVSVPIDELIRLSGLSPAVVQTVLLELELAGALERQAGGRVSLR